MNSKQFTTDDSGVSPVIGVILMVAITVILAAVIGTFVMDLGQNSASQQASAGVSVSGNDATLTSLGGGTDGIKCSGVSLSEGDDEENNASWTTNVGESVNCSNSVVAFSHGPSGPKNASVYTFD